MEKYRKTLVQLFIPICLETLLFMLAGMVDTLMLSSVNDNAVGAVGTANTYVSIFIIMFGIITWMRSGDVYYYVFHYFLRNDCCYVPEYRSRKRRNSISG